MKKLTKNIEIEEFPSFTIAKMNEASKGFVAISFYQTASSGYDTLNSPSC